MLNFKEKLLIYLAAMSACAILVSNIAAVKLWDLFGIAVDGGVIVFPITYIIGDLIVEFYGKKIAKSVIYASFIMNLIAIIVFYIVIALPPFEGWTMQSAFSSVLGFTPRIIIGSLCAYVSSSILNNYIFVKLKNRKGIFADSFIARALGSSAFAHVIDSAIFETVAFLGVLPLQAFITQACFAYVLGIGLEIVLAPVEATIAKVLRVKYDKLSK